MSLGDLLFLLGFCIALPLLGLWMCLWMAKKAGIKPGMRYYEKLFYDNYSGLLDTARQNHRGRPGQSYYHSKKGGKQSIEVTCTRGTLLLEFYTEDSQVLQSWRNGDPAVITVELPPKKRVYRRMRMEHFSGSIAFLKKQAAGIAE